MFYSVSIFEKSGSSINSNLATIILGVVNIMATIVSNALVDRYEYSFFYPENYLFIPVAHFRVGRKMLLYVSDAGMIVSLGVFGAFFYMKVQRVYFGKKLFVILL